MEKINVLPKEYEPFRIVNFCSNSFINGSILVEIKSNIALLVGKGENPIIWLSIPQAKKDSKLTSIIKNNKAYQGKVNVLLPINETIISLKDHILLHVHKLNEDEAEILEIDLQPIGLNIHGDKDGLYIGTVLLKDNKFFNVRTMIYIDK